MQEAESPDIIEFEGNSYAVAGINGPEPFTPRQYGLEPLGFAWGLQRGFQAFYLLQDNSLVLDSLCICSNNLQKPSSLLGIDPVKEEVVWTYDYRYNNVLIELPFTGFLLIARGFIENIQEEVGFHPIWKYTIALELHFRRGRLLERRDCSTKLAKLRAQAVKQPIPSRPNRNSSDRERESYESWLDKAFDRSYTLEH